MPSGHGSLDTHAVQALHEDNDVVLSHQQGRTEEGATRLKRNNYVIAIHVDVEVDSHLHLEPSRSNSEIVSFVKRVANDLKLPGNFLPSIQMLLYKTISELAQGFHQ
ncbi:uncharacterized protein LOC120690922 isoform X3 [Panicum virgatum]|uniref:uncharacterized protein LOC120690922 isoform X3 n=1 Tax=Panicum virgatum TaxID=38727 RepID=UPI0019D61014|nr:uncharacterized protein LOC120690922 isoform X3 [Panicum virgatum]